MRTSFIALALTLSLISLECIGAPKGKLIRDKTEILSWFLVGHASEDKLDADCLKKLTDKPLFRALPALGMAIKSIRIKRGPARGNSQVTATFGEAGSLTRHNVRVDCRRTQ